MTGEGRLEPEGMGSVQLVRIAAADDAENTVGRLR